MKRVITIVFVSAIIFSLRTGASALDTTGQLTVGAFTDFEAYYSLQYGKGSLGHGWDFFVGGGFIKQFGYMISLGIGYRGPNVEIGGLGFKFVWNPVIKENFSMDIMPSVIFVANSESGKLTYPGFDAFSTGLDVEFNILASKSFQPFIVIGFFACYDHSIKEFSWNLPIRFGGLVPVRGKVEFLMQLGWTPAQDVVWFHSERLISAGLNVGATDFLEVITEVGYEFTAKDFFVTMGLIYAI